MAYDDAKRFRDGRAYTGMRVGGRHDWDYSDGRWEEQKIAPDQWSFRYTSGKHRRHRAPTGSGAPPGTMFHWLTVAHQRVRKVDENTYQTFMEGAKWKLAHRRPNWRRWSSEYKGQPTARERAIAVLEETLARLKADQEMAAPRLESLLDPAVYGARERRLEEWDPPLHELLEDETATAAE